jgi:hypothetical protein
MRARGPCTTRSNATRLHMHRRLQACIDVALRSLRSRAKIDEQGTVVPSRRRPRCARLGRAVTGLRAVVTWLECARDAERCWCGATCPLRRCHSRHGCQAATVRAVVDSALQSVNNGSTTGSGRVRRAFRSPAASRLAVTPSLQGRLHCLEGSFLSTWDSAIVLKRQSTQRGLGSC